MQGGFIPGMADPPELLDLLSTAGLLQSPSISRPLYSLPQAIRQLLSRHLEFRYPNRYRDINQLALELWEKWILNRWKEPVWDHRITDQIQVLLAIEALFHHAQVLRMNAVPSSHAREALLEATVQYLGALETSFDSSYLSELVRQFGDTLRSDEELTVLLTRIIDADGYKYLIE